METATLHSRLQRHRGGGGPLDTTRGRGQPWNKHWSADVPSRTSSAGGGGGHSSDAERWERGGHKGGHGARGGTNRGGRRFPNASLRINHVAEEEQAQEDVMEDQVEVPTPEKEAETPEERERFYQEVCASFHNESSLTNPFVRS